MLQIGGDESYPHIMKVTLFDGTNFLRQLERLEMNVLSI